MSDVLNPSAWKGALLKRKAEIMEQVFLFPPSDYAGFQRYLGQFQENQLTLDSLEAVMKGIENDDEVRG